MKGSAESEEKDDLALPKRSEDESANRAPKEGECSPLEAAAAVATMRAGWAVLTQERFIRKFLDDVSKSDRSGKTLIRSLIEVAITPTASGGVIPVLDKVEQLWLSLWSEWNERAHRIRSFKADTQTQSATGVVPEDSSSGATDVASVASDISSTEVVSHKEGKVY